MHGISKIMKVGGSYAMILPGEMLEHMKLNRNDKLFIQYDNKKATIEKLDDIIKNRDKKEDG